MVCIQVKNFVTATEFFLRINAIAFFNEAQDKIKFGNA